ncbi:hypothetical protein GJW-30_1_02080 [Variibacter gotjawalensis]|uniref:Uncharacterized protein n=1 Tax=Variibacter gotjawalensis TaxID=1333996 RepID=A0A0S3PUF3_9BRAD|nr:hypothetical protein [Variibacter gotjawalensis]RZS45872.1 hypothetical protein EV661_4198 [Variibacter gotjawalensis]BAT59547.1 hypothetical protein GJW-30_1_02080 [Variibacter gotjawalensis]
MLEMESFASLVDIASLSLLGPFVAAVAISYAVYWAFSRQPAASKTPIRPRTPHVS